VASVSDPINRAIECGDYSQLAAVMGSRLDPHQHSQLPETSLHRQLWDWLCWLKGAGRADSTISAYARDMQEFATWLELQGNVSLRPHQLKPSHVQDYQAYLGQRLSRASVCRKLNALNGFFKYLIRAGVMKTNPLDVVPRSRPKNQRDKWLPEDEAMQVLTILKTPIEQAIFMICYRAGLRRGEIQTLKTSDVDLENRMLRVYSTKNNTTRYIPVSDELAYYLQEYLRTRPPCEHPELFITRHGNPLGKSTLDRWFRRWMKQAGLKDKHYRLHDLRHSAATNWIRNGLNIVEVKQLLGHTSIESIGRYLHHAMNETRAKVNRIHFGQEDDSPRASTDNGDTIKELTLQMARAAAAGDLQLVQTLGKILNELSLA